MLRTAPAIITTIVRANAQVIEARAIVQGEDRERRVIGYPSLVGTLGVGDSVLLNITATELALGTGGYDFVITNRSFGESEFGEPDGSEHIIKLRYTPHQHAVRTVEMMPEFTAIWERAKMLRGTPVVVCELHSQVAAVCAGVKAQRADARVAYVYTDTAALPIGFSRLVPQLKTVGLLDVAITAGQAFGGDYEAVSVASALIAADWIVAADVVVVGQGPGNAGTGTRYGWSGIEQASHLSLARALGGEAIAVMRVSAGDSRERHRGLSHHSTTVLGTISGRVTIAVPDEPRNDSYTEWWERVSEANDHYKEIGPSEPGLALLAERGVNVTTMGRTIDQDKVFFAFATAAGAVAAARIVEK